MLNSIDKEMKEQKEITKKILSLDKDKDLKEIISLAKKLETLETKRAFLNNEEYMAYAYMAVKMRGSENIKEVLNDFNKWWLKMTNKKMPKKMMKYFYSYWMVKDDL
jgi:asparagine synthetase B (glutamine-hydrolysing)